MSENKAPNESVAFGWDDEVEEQPFELMPDGDYHFTVTGMERAWFEPKRADSKISACPQANVELTFKWRNSNGFARTSKLTHQLKLTSSLSFLIFNFFAGIGLHKEGDGMKKFPWNDIMGRTGIASVSTREGRNGGTFNTVESVYAPDKAPTVCANDNAGGAGDDTDAPF